MLKHGGHRPLKICQSKQEEPKLLYSCIPHRTYGKRGIGAFLKANAWMPHKWSMRSRQKSCCARSLSFIMLLAGESELVYLCNIVM
ncbi:hypothetical protein BAE44_0000507 [Dichanthelium oligosanthes]|uniref:Uncharacterized protein n=1 Tax=Dichanthelium oligosanthes TaxID=888268 RepID=A0A1E5WM27_9POAL|nr:hypothetical protein BAE44_0000507 [Dichanthelium oligosanthes]